MHLPSLRGDGILNQVKQKASPGINFTRTAERGGGRCLNHVTIDHASLSRRSTVYGRQGGTKPNKPNNKHCHQAQRHLLAAYIIFLVRTSIAPPAFFSNYLGGKVHPSILT